MQIVPIKGLTWVAGLGMTSKRNDQPRFASLCAASLIRSGYGSTEAEIGDFNAIQLHDFFFQRQAGGQASPAASSCSGSSS
jgi:hypothetical protein